MNEVERALSEALEMRDLAQKAITHGRPHPLDHVIIALIDSIGHLIEAIKALEVRCPEAKPNHRNGTDR